MCRPRTPASLSRRTSSFSPCLHQRTALDSARHDSQGGCCEIPPREPPRSQGRNQREATMNHQIESPKSSLLTGCANASMTSAPQGRAILFALVLAIVLAPIGAQAADKLISIVDDDSASVAQVDSGSLRIGDGSGPVTVDGSVRSAPGPVGDAVQARRGLSGTTVAQAMAGPFAADASLAITSVIVSNDDTASREVGFAIVTTPSTCSAYTAVAGPQHFYIVPAQDTVQLTFPQALIVPELPIPAGASWCLQAVRQDPGTGFVDVEVVGYTLT